MLQILIWWLLVSCLDKIIDYVIPILHSVLASGARPLECTIDGNMGGGRPCHGMSVHCCVQNILVTTSSRMKCHGNITLATRLTSHALVLYYTI